MREPLITEFGEAAMDIYNQIRAKLISPHFIIYGHSMGAYLALRVTNMLARDMIYPAHLIVSGNPGPGIEDSIKRYQLDYDDLIAELKKLDGIPEELYQNPELLNFFIPILKADFEVAEKNNLEDEMPVKVPLYALMGSEEEKCEQISNWSRFTTASFRYELLEGGHFFINKHPQRLGEIFRECAAEKITKIAASGR